MSFQRQIQINNCSTSRKIKLKLFKITLYHKYVYWHRLFITKATQESELINSINSHNRKPNIMSVLHITVQYMADIYIQLKISDTGVFTQTKIGIFRSDGKLFST